MAMSGKSVRLRSFEDTQVGTENANARVFFLDNVRLDMV